jgi:probable F420-dependent oxidoreductase
VEVGWFGVGLGALGDLDGVVAAAAAAERLGYESVWVGEHPVVIDPQAPPSPVRPETAFLDPLVVLAHVAATCPSLRLGTGIVILPLRNPLILGKQLASLDVLSGGRLILGIGVGYVPGEYEAIGVPFERRGRIADECVDALRRVWCDDRPALDGEFVRFSGIQSRPRPVQPGGVPIVGSGMSEAALRRCVDRLDGWYGFHLDVAATERMVTWLRAIERERGRPDGRGPLEITISPPAEVTAEEARAYADLGVDRLVVMREYGDNGRRPTPELRATVLESMERMAGALDLTPRGGPGVAGVTPGPTDR